MNEEENELAPTLDELDAEYAAQKAKEVAAKDVLADAQRVHKHSMLWAGFAAGALADPNVCAEDAAEIADELLEEWISRFEESDDGDEDSEDGDE